MPLFVEATPSLPAYAVRATHQHRLVIDEVDSSNREIIVHTGIGPQIVPIIFRCDGIVIFEFDKSNSYSGGSISSYILPDDGKIPPDIRSEIETRDKIRNLRYRYMNAFLSCFNSSFSSSNNLSDPASPEKYIWARFVDPNWVLQDNGSCNIDVLPYVSTISLESLQKIVKLLNDFDLGNFETALDVLDLYYRICLHASRHEFQTSLVLSWTVIEICQNILWERFVRSGYKSINPTSSISGKRRKLLLGSRDYTASIKSQILSLCGIYRDDELSDLDNVRKNRNNFMHGLNPINSQECFIAQVKSRDMIRKSFGVQLGMFGGLGSWDYTD